ncbi:MAG: hypothetical protein KGL34_00165, partial [Gammaproteobacteria bacterium]|nr:hypothetical protein [Gammaproteobacteria bacterium]
GSGATAAHDARLKVCAIGLTYALATFAAIGTGCAAPAIPVTAATAVTPAADVGTSVGPLPTNSQLPSAATLVERNLAARGGVAAWHKIRSMVWTGRIDSSRLPVPSVHFTMYQGRPNRSRFEIDAMGSLSVRVFDGTQGFTIRGAGPQGPGSVEPFSPLELAFARQAPGIDGPLMDATERGGRISLDGTDVVDGHRTYVVQVRLAGGEVDHVWLDARTYLERKLERNAVGPGGRPVAVLMYYHGYKVVDGLTVPSTIETASRPGMRPDRIVIERMNFNAPLSPRLFEPPAGVTATAGGAGAGDHSRGGGA